MAKQLINTLTSGDKLTLSRVLTQVENNTAAGNAALEELFPYTGHAHLIGITGAPGSGKSTLVNYLALNLRQSQNIQTKLRVGIIAVDPTSPFTGGALLGDRVRMRDLYGDEGVFIRSMATRGALGGLAHTTAAFTQVLDAAGYDIILIETVGAGQSEVEIARLAHTVIVVEAPGMGDDIQMIKAGILEIADILVANKADKPGAENNARALRAMLEMAHSPGSYAPSRKHLLSSSPDKSATTDEQNNEEKWTPPVITTVATEGKGFNELLQAIKDHRNYLKSSGEWEQREQANLKLEFEILIRDTLTIRWSEKLPQGVYESTMRDLYQRKIAPHTAVEKLLAYNK